MNTTDNETYDGTWIIKGFFWYCHIDEEKKTVDVTKKDIFYEDAIILDKISYTRDMIKHSLDKLNSVLPEYLKKNNLKQWIPCRRISYDAVLDQNIFEICYYHDNILHDIFYEDDRKSRDLSDKEIITIDEFYYHYGLNFLSDNVYATK